MLKHLKEKLMIRFTVGTLMELADCKGQHVACWEMLHVLVKVSDAAVKHPDQRRERGLVQVRPHH